MLAMLDKTCCNDTIVEQFLVHAMMYFHIALTPDVLTKPRDSWLHLLRIQSQTFFFAPLYGLLVRNLRFYTYD
jgi:hypothetical protein